MYDMQWMQADNKITEFIIAFSQSEKIWNFLGVQSWNRGKGKSSGFPI